MGRDMWLECGGSGWASRTDTQEVCVTSRRPACGVFVPDPVIASGSQATMANKDQRRVSMRT